MKRLSILACALSLVAAGCDGKISPTTPSGVVNLAAGLSAARVLPPPAGPETGGVGQVQVSFTPGASGYTANFTLTVGNLPATTIFVAGYIQAASAGAVGPPVVSSGISATAPILTPTGGTRLELTGAQVPAALAQAIIANPSGYYFQLYSFANQTGALRGQLAAQ